MSVVSISEILKPADFYFPFILILYGNEYDRDKGIF